MNVLVKAACQINKCKNKRAYVYRMAKMRGFQIKGARLKQVKHPCISSRFRRSCHGKTCPKKHGVLQEKHITCKQLPNKIKDNAETC